jgi:hypothetical protein
MAIVPSFSKSGSPGKLLHPVKELRPLEMSGITHPTCEKTGIISSTAVRTSNLACPHFYFTILNHPAILFGVT